MCCSPSPSVGWRFFFKQPKLVLTERKITNRQTLKNAENSNCSCSNGVGPNLMTTTKLSAGYTATLCRTSNRVVVFFDSFELLFSSLSYLLTARDGSCQVLVVQSFAFSFRLSKVKSLIELLRSFCVYQRENPMIRILNSLSSCCDVDMLLQGNSVM